MPDAENYLFHTLQSKEFIATYVSELIEKIANAETGKVFHAEGKRALIDRGVIIISEEQRVMPVHTIFEKAKDVFIGNKKVLFRTVALANKKFLIPKNPSVNCIDKDLLKYPLTLRTWKAGDFFYPLGMKGKKKISDYLVDEKINRFEKENICVLLSGKDIVCIVGHRIDERYKITPRTINVLKVEVR
jgi:tRNA(Ile)-lysidine synthase